MSVKVSPTSMPTMVLVIELDALVFEIPWLG
jgi:hypothetical protein